MSDGQPDIKELFIALAQTGGKYNERSPFEIMFEGEIVFEADDNLCTILLVVKPRRGDASDAVRWPAIQFPSNMLSAAEKREMFKATDSIFKASLRAFFSHEAALLVADTVNRAIAEMSSEPLDKREIIKAHTRAVADRLRKWLNIKSKGRSRQWATVDLTRAVQGVMRDLQPALRTYENVAKRLREVYGERAPKSGDSLKKLVRELNVDWMGLKSESEK